MISFKQFLLKEAESFDGKMVDKWTILASLHEMDNTTCAYTSVKVAGGDYDDDLYLGIMEPAEWNRKKYFYVVLDDNSQQFKTLADAVKYIKTEFNIVVSTKVQEALLSTFAAELANGFN
jgi:hypothetical protein